MSFVKVKVAQSSPTLWDPTDYTVCGILQAKYWSGLSFPSPWDLLDPGIEAAFPQLAGGFINTELPGKP